VEIKDANLSGANYFHLFYRLFPRFIDRLHECGLEAGVWTVNNKRTMRWMMRHSLDYITTDHPDVALSLTGIQKDTQEEN
jgi:glycerophosphoryl diester phosphodiesterase